MRFSFINEMLFLCLLLHAFDFVFFSSNKAILSTFTQNMSSAIILE